MSHTLPMHPHLDLLAFYRAAHRPRLKPRSATDYDLQLGFFSRYLSGWLSQQTPPASPREPTITDLTTEHVLGAVAWQLGRTRSNSTADKLRRVLLAVWATAHACGRLGPPPRLKKLHGQKHEPTAWTLAEFERLLYAAGELPGTVGPFALGKWLSVLLRVGYNSGLRLNALMACQWSWINWETGLIRIPPEIQKDAEGQTVQLMPGTLAALKTLKENGKPGVFDDWPYDRKVVQWPALTRLLRKAITRAGLRATLADVSKRDLWHKLRRTFATHLYATSSDIEFVRDMLGHSSIEVTKRYIDKSKLGRRLHADYLSDPQPMALRVVS